MKFKIMLRYTEAALSYFEVPNEISLCIYISGCQNNCRNCHYPELKLKDYGLLLKNNIKNLIEVYSSQISCVCFLGEGQNTDAEHKEFSQYTKLIRSYRFRTCLYSGRNIFPENWMRQFDYVKVGDYQEKLGSLFSASTNQRLYINLNGSFKDITHLFWN